MPIVMSLLFGTVCVRLLFRRVSRYAFTGVGIVGEAQSPDKRPKRQWYSATRLMPCASRGTFLVQRRNRESSGIGMKMSKRWKNVFRLLAMQLHVESVWAEIEASRPLRVPGIGQPNLFEYSWFIPRRKNTTSCIG